MPTEHRHHLGALDVGLLLNAIEQRGVNTEELLFGLGLESADWRIPMQETDLRG